MSETNIQVLLRVRNSIKDSQQEKNTNFIQVQEKVSHLNQMNTLIFDTKPEKKSFTYDYVMDHTKNQKDIYESIGQSTLESCLDGYNACIFAYGQTGTGKTFTLSGNNFNPADENRGIQQRIIENLFQKTQQNHQNNTFLIKSTYFEIYNEQIFDLFSEESQPLNIRECINKGVYIERIQEINLENSFQALNVLKMAQHKRRVASHNQNNQSSRSHAVLQLIIEQKIKNNGVTEIKTSKLNLVDLAGSERQKKAQTSGEMLKQASNINKSLTVLGNVINAMQSKNKFIPFRDSKLTFFLKDCLGGNSKTTMIATVNNDSDCFQETLSTLKFAQRVKTITCSIKQNLEQNISKEELQSQIVKLKQIINQQKVQNDQKINQNSLQENILSLYSQLKEINDLDQSQFQDFQNQLNIKPQQSENNFIIEQQKDLLNELESLKLKNDYLEQKYWVCKNEQKNTLEDYDNLYQTFLFKQQEQYNLETKNETLMSRIDSQEFEIQKLKIQEKIFQQNIIILQNNNKKQRILNEISEQSEKNQDIVKNKNEDQLADKAENQNNKIDQSFSNQKLNKLGTPLKKINYADKENSNFVINGQVHSAKKTSLFQMPSQEIKQDTSYFNFKKIKL